MKSITEQASSIAKAVQKGWEKAGKPKEFSVKVFEEPQTNFFGFITKPAKVGIFFEVPVVVRQKNVTPKREASFQRGKPIVTKTVERAAVVRNENVQDRPPAGAGPSAETKEFWNENILQASRTWLTGLLEALNFSTTFELQPSEYDLHIVFQKPLIEDYGKQQQLYRSISVLLMQTLRHKMRRPLRGFRVFLVNGQ